MLSMFRTIFLRPSASIDFTFSRSAFDSSPRTMRPSKATTETPSTSRFVIFNATFVSSSFLAKPILESGSGGNLIRSQKLYQNLAARGKPNPGAAPRRSDVVGARHVIAAPIADQLAPARFEPLRADGTI